ncbi:MAG: GNAT family N-acetyltransferase [Victivallaceae bacterium]|nr:GNAT family protein [Victivallaceae bacterium]
MISLKPIDERGYQDIIDWNNGKDESYLHQWAGHKAYKYPLTIEQIRARAENEKASRIYMIYDDDCPIGSIELDGMDLQNASARICRFILSENKRNMGLGTAALRELVGIAFRDFNIKKLHLGVFCFNVGAIRCYEKCGFRVEQYFHRDDGKWSSYVMSLIRD